MPKKRRKMIFGSIRKHLGEVFHDLARQKGVIIEEGHLMPDHVHIHMCLSIPQKLVVSNVVGFIKGKSAISIARTLKGKQINFSGEAFWAREYFVSTVGLDENMVREYIRNQEKHDADRDQLKLAVKRALGAYFSPSRASSNKSPALPEVI
ncbi:IS200/IS605 family transposase [Pseudoalteromonas sp. NBT06-2]|uniref:IS200/IS605 family transposase n=1 Tax=Pseudoalteromonas sp. NBT06-2 TaxID=2025950 RepID=UPI002075A61A|nr:IS200/IS605 family transposase [Pseudoalteromonas sp. NBT06-2]